MNIDYMALLEDRAKRHVEVKVLLDAVNEGKINAQEAWESWTRKRKSKRK